MMDVICQCALCGAAALLAEARVQGWMAYPPEEHGDDPRPSALATGLSLRCGACVLGQVLVALDPRLDDDAELLTLRDSYLQALARRAAPTQPLRWGPQSAE